jgi:hypothetical protein
MVAFLHVMQVLEDVRLMVGKLASSMGADHPPVTEHLIFTEEWARTRRTMLDGRIDPIHPHKPVLPWPPRQPCGVA